MRERKKGPISNVIDNMEEENKSLKNQLEERIILLKMKQRVIDEYQNGFYFRHVSDQKNKRIIHMTDVDKQNLPGERVEPETIIQPYARLPFFTSPSLCAKRFLNYILSAFQI